MDDSSAAFLVSRFSSMLSSDTDEHLLTVRESLSKCQQPSFYLFAERKKGMMTALTIVLPLLPGKQEPWRRFCQALQGSRHREYAAWREQMGIIQETVWLSQALQGDLVCLHLEVKHPQQVLADLAASHRPFERWFRQQLLELHGLDVMQLAPASAHEVVFVWSPAVEEKMCIRGEEA